ncbi:MAG: hypothetical protein KF699_05970 [Phycisphaeraceae bacterium]|nr:hypothetical protein [Phycisphaeraceae bacterium]MBX3407848.1 hypothetical protein [Phycisphaeraceae bacterium]
MGIRKAWSVLSIAAVLSLAGTVHGQNTIGDGTILDRNLQVGSGGRNTQMLDLQSQIRFNNAIITGSVAGRSFHGSVGYRATDEFAGYLGSNSLYTFRRDTATSAFAGTGVRASDALRYQFALSTGQAVPSALSGGVGLVVPRAGATPAYQPRSTTSSALRSTSEFLSAQSLRPTLIGYRENDDGTVMTASASPLVGITWQPVDTGVRPQTPGARTDINARPNSLTGLEPTVAGMPSPLDITGMGRPTAPAPATARIDSRSENYTRVLDSFRTSYQRILGAEGDAAQPSALALDDKDAPWRTELDRLRESLRVGIDGTRRDDRAPSRVDDPDARPAFDPGAPMPFPGQDVGATRTERERADRERRTVLSPEMVRILRDSGVRIDTLRPASPPVDQTAYVAHMEAGQELLRAGRFFDAEDRFTRALSALPRDPMAAIARVHAQIGAGLFLSAASNLRDVLRANPEISAARFNVALAPSEARSLKIAEQLRQEIERGSDRMAADASLLLAYLGRLHDDAAMRSEGLAAWKSRIAEADDAEAALHELLSKVWGTAP